MLVFAVLAIAFLLFVALPTGGSRRRPREAARLAMAVAMVVTGASHLLMPEPFVQHMPTWVPLREAIIYVTGAVEVLLGLGLLGPAVYRPPVAVPLAAYLIAVFPASVYLAVENVSVDGQPGGVFQWIRLPFQALFIAWALWSVPGSLAALQHPRRALAAVARTRSTDPAAPLGPPTLHP